MKWEFGPPKETGWHWLLMPGQLEPPQMKYITLPEGEWKHVAWGKALICKIPLPDESEVTSEEMFEEKYQQQLYGGEE